MLSLLDEGKNRMVAAAVTAPPLFPCPYSAHLPDSQLSAPTSLCPRTFPIPFVPGNQLCRHMRQLEVLMNGCLLGAGFNQWLMEAGRATTQLPHPSEGITQACILHHCLELSPGNELWLCVITHPSPSHFPTPSWCFLESPPCKITCTWILVSGSASAETPMKTSSHHF